jgi:F0F1-type ATP synthase membrane subunit b/b'
MGLKDLLDYFSKYGPVGVAFAVLLFVVGALYLQILKGYKERLEEANKRVEEANKRAERLENEVKDLNDEIQKFFALGTRWQSTVGEATNEIRRLT